MKLPGGRKAILFVGLPLGLAVAGAFAYLQLSAGPVKAVPDPKPGQLGPMLALDSRVINLQPSAGSSYRYAKISVTVELRPDDASFYALQGEARATAETAALADVNDSVPLLLDAVGQVVSSQDSGKLTTPSGRAALKQQLLTASKTVLGDGKVLDIFLTDLVMQ